MFNATERCMEIVRKEDTFNCGAFDTHGYLDEILID